MAVVGRGGRDVARRVSTTGVKPRQQSQQCAVGLAPHEAVDGGQFGGWPFDKLRDLRFLNTGGEGKQKQSYNAERLHSRKSRKKINISP